MGLFPNKGYSSYDHAAKIESLGRATTDSTTSCETFLVSKRDAPISVRSVTGGAVDRFAVDQLINPDTVIFTPGGIWNDDEILLSGRVGTVSNSLVSQELMNKFRSAITRHFTRINAFWVGARALALFEGGARLTGSVQSPQKFDLRISGVKR